MTKKKEKPTEWVALDTDRDVPYSEYEEFCKDNEREVKPEDSEDYLQYVNDMHDMDYDDFKTNMSSCKLFPMVAKGYCGLWDGNVECGKVLRDVDDLLSMFSSCNRTKIWQDKNGFHINGYHHDGTNSADIRILNKRGIAWLEKNERKVSDRKLIETLSKLCFSRSFPMGHKNYLF